MKHTAILLHPNDDVMTLLVDRKKGENVSAILADKRVQVTLKEDIRFGHKVAIHDIAKGASILKYGMPIGRAVSKIEAGQWVHTHNCRSHRYGYCQEKYGIHA